MAIARSDGKPIIDWNFEQSRSWNNENKTQNTCTVHARLLLTSISRLARLIYFKYLKSDQEHVMITLTDIV